MENLSNSQIWKEAPFIRLLIPLLAGILLQFFFPITKSLNGLILACCALALIFTIFMPVDSLFGWGWMAGLFIHTAFLALGRLLIVCHQDIQVAPPNQIPVKYSLIAELENDPARKSRTFKAISTIRYLCETNACYTEKEKIFIYFQANQLPLGISAGTVIIFNKPLLPIENSSSPQGFDYRHYCRLKHIYAQVFLGPSDYRILGGNRENPVRSVLISWRRKLLRIIKQYIPGKEENSLLEALMIGYTEDLDRELVQSYSNTGVVHIIAISGLHLTLIYQILQLLLQKINVQKSGKWAKLIILLGSLWTFSFLSGASPSVIRSAVMFSILLVARTLSRESIVYNTLASSAFILLCFDPYWLWDTGFQLSYTAVLSLVIFMKPVRGMLILQNKWLSVLWNSASLSLAAQILTTPISIYYFHRFPNYFLFCNLLAVPLSSIILVGGILLCFFYFFPFLANGIAWVLIKLIDLLNGFVQYLSQLPGAVTNQLSINIPQVILQYLLIYCLVRFFNKGEKKWFTLGLVSICLLFFIRILTWNS